MSLEPNNFIERVKLRNDIKKIEAQIDFLTASREAIQLNTSCALLEAKRSLLIAFETENAIEAAPAVNFYAISEAI